MSNRKGNRAVWCLSHFADGKWRSASVFVKDLGDQFKLPSFEREQVAQLIKRYTHYEVRGPRYRREYRILEMKRDS